MRELLMGVSKRDGKKVILNFNYTTNANGILFGQSGTGKTHLLRAIARAFSIDAPEQLTSIIFDVHGDIFPEAHFVSSVEIYRRSKMGLQPFEINPCVRYGGVFNSIENFLNAINTSSTKLGPRQTATLGRLIEELYQEMGFHAEKPETWTLRDSENPNKRFPTFSDLLKFVEKKQEEVYLGVNSNTLKHLEAFKSKSKTVNKMRLRGEDSTGEYSEEAIELAKEAAMNAYTSFLDSSEHDNLLKNLIQYDKGEVLASISDRLGNLHKTGIFKDEPIIFDESKGIHRYDISLLKEEEQKIFIQLKLSEIFRKAKEGGFGGKTQNLIFIDEAKNYIDNSEHNMIRKFYNEIRKFGYGIWLGGQRIEHFDDDIVTNSATKIILGIDANYAKKFSTRLNIPIEYILNIQKKKSMLIEINSEEKESGFREVNFVSSK